MTPLQSFYWKSLLDKTLAFKCFKVSLLQVGHLRNSTMESYRCLGAKSYPTCRHWCSRVKEHVQNPSVEWNSWRHQKIG